MNIYEVCDNRNIGLMAKFMRALQAIYDIHVIKKQIIVINWSKIPYYYDASYGENVWEYFFEQPSKVNIDKKSTVIQVGEQHYGYPDCNNQSRMDQLQSVAHNNIKVKNNVTSIVDDFYNANMRGKRVLGVHKRGCAMYSPDVSKFRIWKGHGRNYVLTVDDYFRKIDEFIIDFDCVLLITDESLSLNHFRKQYGRALIHYDEALLSDANCEEIYLDVGRSSPYKIGEDVLVECILLSKCDKIICTQSNVSMASYGFSSLRYSDVYYIDKHIKMI